MVRKKLDLVNLPSNPENSLKLVEAALEHSVNTAVQHVQQLPSKRAVHLRPDHEPKFELERPHMKYGALVQSRGDAPEVACDNCRANKGPFTECILLDTQLLGGCANCYVTRPAFTPARCSLGTEGMKSRMPEQSS